MAGPAALRWRFGPAHHARIAPQCRWLRQNIYCGQRLAGPTADAISMAYL